MTPPLCIRLGRVFIFQLERVMHGDKEMIELSDRDWEGNLLGSLYVHTDECHGVRENDAFAIDVSVTIGDVPEVR